MKTLKLTDETKKLLEQYGNFRDKWVKGLRSGKYTQIQNSMMKNDVPNSACCLHVMEMECNGVEWGTYKGLGFPDDYHDQIKLVKDGQQYEVNSVIKASLSGKVHKNGSSPSFWNDNLKLSFIQIADLLEFGEVDYE